MIGNNKDMEYNSKVYSSFFVEYNITPLDIRRKIRLLNIMFDLKVTGQHIKPDQNSTYNLRSSNKIKFEQKKIRLRVFDISPLERGIKLWNMLPAVVQSLDYKPDFQKEVRHVIM